MLYISSPKYCRDETLSELKKIFVISISEPSWLQVKVCKENFIVNSAVFLAQLMWQRLIKKYRLWLGLWLGLGPKYLKAIIELKLGFSFFESPWKNYFRV